MLYRLTVECKVLMLSNMLDQRKWKSVDEIQSGLKARRTSQLFVESKVKILSRLDLQSTVETLFSMFSRNTFHALLGCKGELTIVTLVSLSSRRKFELLAHRPIIGNRQETIAHSTVHSQSTHAPLTSHVCGRSSQTWQKVGHPPDLLTMHVAAYLERERSETCTRNTRTTIHTLRDVR